MTEDPEKQQGKHQTHLEEVPVGVRATGATTKGSFPKKKKSAVGLAVEHTLAKQLTIQIILTKRKYRRIHNEGRESKVTFS